MLTHVILRNLYNDPGAKIVLRIQETKWLVQLAQLVHGKHQNVLFPQCHVENLYHL